MRCEWTKEDYDTLRAAIFAGQTHLTFKGPPARTVSYDHHEDEALSVMRSLLSEMRSDLMTRGIKP